MHVKAVKARKKKNTTNKIAITRQEAKLSPKIP
jgi:hypothetical protein